MPPMVLFETLKKLGVPDPAKMTETMVAEAESVQTTLPVAVWLPSVLPVIFPQLISPESREMSDCDVPVLDDVMLIF